jgi:phosphotransferase system enzyme I (PtsI)
VIIDPVEGDVERYKRKQEEYEREQTVLSELVALPAETADGVRIKLLANIGSVDEARDAARLGAEGIGLFRTEMIFMAAKLFLSEEEQFDIYRSVAEIMGGKPVTIRILDIGGDKFVGPENPYNEHNPYLGYRSIRVMLDRPQLFLGQMRAILRAGLHGDVRMLWPMISSVEELRAAQAKLDEARDGLRREGIPFREDMPAGVMIEIPSAALVSDRLAAESDFLSIGTNDLVQYTLAVDRGNVYVEHLYRPHDPAVIYLIARTIEGAASARKPVALCGEMGGVPCYVPLLVGLGLREFSVAPGRMLRAKRELRETDTTTAADLARRAVEATTASDVEAIIGWRSSCSAGAS